MTRGFYICQRARNRRGFYNMISNNNPVAEVVFIVLVLSWLIQLLFYWISFRRLAWCTGAIPQGEEQPVSVIICAKNEALNLRKNLESVLNQKYPRFEVIVVNDCSWDETGTYLEETSKKYEHLKIVNIKEQEKYRHGKKFALTLGIKAAANDILLLTDADCMPAGPDWISKMSQHFTSGTEIVLGYGAMKHEPGFLNRLIRFDGFLIAMQYFSFALGGFAYMGVGRNLAYRKSLFFKTKGFANHYHIFSGDDDLFVNENANRRNTKIEYRPGSFTYSESRKSFGAWLKQKSRHLGTAGYYKTGDKFRLFMNWFSNVLMYAGIVSLLILRTDWRILLSVYLGYILFRFPVFWKCASRLQEKDLPWLYPVLEPVHLIIQPVFFFSNLFTKQKAWK